MLADPAPAPEPALASAAARRPRGAALSLALAGLLAPLAADAQGLLANRLGVKNHADAVLSLMAYSVVPDLTSSSLSINNANTDNPGVTMIQFGGGFTVSKSLPLYLEGAAAYSRYDPTFVASDGTESRRIPTRWNSVSGTGGIGWDFFITPELALRPIFDFSLGKVASDLKIAEFLLENRFKNLEVDFLNGGSLNAYGLGGALMLDFERVRPDYEADLELRYTDIQLRTFGNTAAAVEGKANARTANVYARYRAPTGLYSLDRPVRYVLEFSYSQYLGSQAEVLGFDSLTSLGLGLELDSSAKDLFITRTRAVLRYVFGNNVSGVSLGLAVSF